MKKEVILLAFAVIISIGVASAQQPIACNPDASLINQDPYPAVPGDIVKVVFQVDGTDNPECGTVTLEIIPEFPFSLEPGGRGPMSTASFFTYSYAFISTPSILDRESTFIVVNKSTSLSDMKIDYHGNR